MERFKKYCTKWINSPNNPAFNNREYNSVDLKPFQVEALVKCFFKVQPDEAYDYTISALHIDDVLVFQMFADPITKEIVIDTIAPLVLEVYDEVVSERNDELVT